MAPHLRLLKPLHKLSRYPRCIHLSHRLSLPCWYGAVWDGFCKHHNNSCWGECE